jgi:hypothetical protein
MVTNPTSRSDRSCSKVAPGWRSSGAWAALALLAVSFQVGAAGIAPVTTRAAMGADDSAVWSVDLQRAARPLPSMNRLWSPRPFRSPRPRC